MEILPTVLLETIKEKESISTEFKKSKNKLPSSLFESVCGMLNRNGGHIFLGVDDLGNIEGIESNLSTQLKKDFVTMCNNNQIITPTIRLEIKEYNYKDRTLLYIFVPESSNVHRYKNRIFDRNEDGDFDITDNTILVSEMYIRKSSTYIENKIFPYATMDDLREDLINRVRIMAVNRDPNHIWKNMTNMELLKSAALYEKNILTGETGFNQACILLFGKDETIASTLSFYKTDAILRVNNTERYDDRDDIRTNLIESYERLVAFISKHLNDYFFLEENGQRTDVRNTLSREICTNLLIHREFSNPQPARLIITSDRLITENANKPRTIGYIDIDNYTPYPKNPKIASVFKEIGLADELGSGIKKIVKYAQIYSKDKPTFEDGNTFTMTMPLPKLQKEYIKEKKIPKQDIKWELYNFIKNIEKASITDISSFLKPLLNTENEKDFLNKRRNLIDFLKRNGYIENCGSKKKPMWVVIKNR